MKSNQRKSSFIEERAKEVLQRLGTNQLKQAYAQALKKSITLDIDNKRPGPSTVVDLYDLYGFDPKLQRSYFVSLNKQGAKLFLEDMGFDVKTNFDKIFNRPAYQELFGKDAFTVGKRQMILSYAEWLHLVKYEFEPEYPKFLQQYLK